MRLPRMWAAAAVVGSIVGPIGTVVFPSPAAGQVALEARLVEFPPWSGPQDTLRAVFEVTNRGDALASDLRVSIAVHQAIATRSHLERSFDGRLGAVEASDTVSVEGSIEPGATQQLVVEKPLSEFRFLQADRSDRAYPVRFVVRSGSVSTAPIDTHLIFFAQTAATPLEVGLVIPIDIPPVYGPDMGIRRAELDRVLGPRGPLALLDTLRAHPEAQITVVPTGLTLHLLADVSDGFVQASANGTQRVERDDPAVVRGAQLLEALRQTARAPASRVAISTFSATSLPWLVRSGMSDRAQAQVASSRFAIDRVLGTPALQGWLVPPYGALDEPTTTVLLRSEVTSFVVAPSSLRPSRRQVVLTRGAPVAVPTRTGTSGLAFIADAGLAERLIPRTGVGPVRARQRFLAETATIMLERPAQRRAIFAVAPPRWAPEPQFLGDLLYALTSAPWMSGTTPDRAATLTPGGTAELAPEDIADGPSPPSGEYLAALRAARREVEVYGEIAPPPERLAGLETKLLIAESSEWWASRRLLDRGRSFARSITSDVAAEFDKIRAPAAQTITLTSRTGVIPLVVSTATEYAVQIVIRLDSDKLRFPAGDLIQQQLQPPAQTIDVPAVAEASGTFPLRVIVQTESGRTIDDSRMVVRSTAYNAVAVIITATSGAFLIVWWAIGFVRRRLAR